jgi:hypothetical protein
MTISRVGGGIVAALAAIAAAAAVAVLEHQTMGGVEVRLPLGAGFVVGLGVLWAADKFGLIEEPYRQSAILERDDDRPFVTGNTPIDPR